MKLLFVYIQVAEQVSKVSGVKKVLLADNEAFKGFLPGKARLNYIYVKRRQIGRF